MKTTFKKIITYILQIESRLVLSKYKPKIIAITGSIGKTSTKDAVYAVLSKMSYVRKSDKSYNSEIGLPLTILGIPNGWNNPLIWLKNIFKGLWLFLASHKYPEWLVLEVGIGHPGDMRRIASWLKTDVVIITAIGETPAHIEFFNSRKNLIEEKSKLVKTLRQEGLLILNADDPDVLLLKKNSKHRVKTYGFKGEADILGSGDSIFYDEEKIPLEPKGIIFRVDEDGKSLPVVIEGVFGRNHVYASLATLAFSSGFKFNMLTAINSLKNYDVPPGRMRLLKGINNSMIIDDTYNSSPLACGSALETLGEIKANGRKIAILGDMLELGKHTEEAHRNIGKMAGKILRGNADMLIVVGPRAKAIKEGALETGMDKKNILEFLDSSQAGEFVKNSVQAGDWVLIKGSQSMRMERVSEQILLDKENKDKLLVRQEKEWLEKI
ncbi:MAG: UDP-N-acetylmuramoyl-tripeptide--D-alanyl-D-alanine ligase [Patescibacteria group bacterium]